MQLLLLACTGGPVDSAAPAATLTAVTFNTGTSEGMGHDAEPDDGYTGEHAEISDTWYGDGLAWLPAVAATEAFFTQVEADVVGFQEIHWSEECADIPEENDVDVSDLEVGEKLFVDEAILPDNVEAVYEQRFPLLSIAAKGVAVEEMDEAEDEEGEESEDEDEDEE